jgi:hypothetical protein
MRRTQKKKIPHHATAPKKKKTWTPWLHSRMISSLATKKFYAEFVLFIINGGWEGHDLWEHGLSGSDVLLWFRRLALVAYR